MGKRASLKPKDADKGGNFGFPPGSVVTITDCEFTTWGEAGEKAITKGRKATDPALKLVGEIEGVDEDRPPVFLGAGKSERLEPSADGDHLEIADGSSATAVHESSDTKIFLDSIFYDSDSKEGKKNSKAYKMHGDDALPDSVLDDGIRAALIGLKFKAGTEVVRQRRPDDTQDPKPSLICDEIIEKPSGKGKAKKKARPAADEDEDEDEPAPKKKTTKKPADDDDNDNDADDDDEAPKKKTTKKTSGGSAEKAAEKAGVKALANPKYRKGCEANRFYNAVFAVVKDDDDADAIMKLVGDEEWAQDDARPWVWDSEKEVYSSATED